MEISVIKPSKFELLEYYSRDDVLDEMMKISQHREFVAAAEGKYLSRPSMIQFKSDIVEFVRRGATSFHCSVERWKNPMMLSTEKKNYDEIRIGWDLVLDIDSRIGIEAAAIAAKEVCRVLKSYGIESYGIKFSGSRGFHILVPWEAFPKSVNYVDSAKQYPKILNAIVAYICECIKDSLLKKLIEKYTAKQLFDTESADPFALVEIEKNWGERHLFRAPYSLNEKTWLVSVPVENLDEFSPAQARMKRVRATRSFFREATEEEARELLIDALDWSASREAPEREKKTRAIRRIESGEKIKVPEEYFPPCIKNILKGLADGRKRSTFTLINFLRNVGYDWDEIEAKLQEWNSRNEKPLSTSFINSQLNWNRNQRNLLPANCDNELFYKSIGICEPDNVCREIKNPVTYPFKIFKPKIRKKRERKALFVCRRCNRAFSSEKGLIIHQRRVHGDEVL